MNGMLRSIIHSFVLLSAITTALSVAGCSRGGDAVPPNVVIITLDTVRSDHLGCYGYPRPTSPHIDALADVATLFTRSLVTSPWTVPTHASMFTGKFSFEHGAHAFEVPEGTVNNVNPLPKSELTIAEVLWEHGYATGAVVANEAFLSQRWQLNQGFETYVVRRTYAPEVNRRVFRWLDAVKDRPFFLFINYIDAHRPYNTRPRPGVTKRAVVQDEGELLDSLYHAVMPGTGDIPVDLANKVTDQYDTAIANVDDAVGELIERLRRSGVYENTVVVVTSDHGEFLGEHHLVEHSKDVYQEVLTAPLIIKAPGQSNGLVDNRIVTSTDIPGLILNHFPPQWVDELAKFRDAPGNHEVIAEIYYTRTKDLFSPKWGHRFNRIRTALFDWPYKLISSSDGQNELYHLERDPSESSNLIDSETVVAARLATRLQEFFASRMRSDERVDQPPLSEEELKRLRSLGYVGQ